MSDEEPLSDADRQALLRFRLALGPGAEKIDPSFSLAKLLDQATAAGIDPSRASDLDQALSFVYEDKKGSLAASRPYVPKWLAALREFFRHEVVALVQRDAIERRGLTQLLLEPETLPFLEKNVELAAMLVAAKGVIPDKAKEAARAVIREVTDEVRKALEVETRTALLGAVRRVRQSPLRVAKNLDFSRTIRRNLHGWDSERKRLVAEKLYFFQNHRRKREWDLVLLVDQSGSMAESVVYAAVMAAIFASIDVLQTKLVLFDTEVVDATPLLVDPVDVLFAAELGGGTDINRAVAYAETLIERPERTIVVLISDLFEGGSQEELVQRMRRLVEARVRVLTLLALTDTGRPAFDHDLARELEALSIPCFGCTPSLLPRVMERVIQNQDLRPLLKGAATT